MRRLDAGDRTRVHDSRHAELVEESSERDARAACGRFRGGRGGRRGATMKTPEILRANLDRSVEVHRRMIDACLPELSRAADALVAAYLGGRKAIFFGN